MGIVKTDHQEFGVVSDRASDRLFWRSYLRALAGALIFSLPLLMTMEMWEFGMYLARERLALFILAFLPVLVGLSRYSGFKKTQGLLDDVVDAMVAVSAGVMVSSLFLMVFGILAFQMSLDEILGKIALLSVPGSMGALIASKNLGSGMKNQEEKDDAGYAGELFIMTAGALFLAFNLAPTEEMVLIAYKMTIVQTALLVLLSLLIMHALVYTLEFRGQHSTQNASFLRLAYSFTLGGYAVSLLLSAFVLWTFGRFDGLGVQEAVTTTAVLGFPAALGASTARLVI